MKVTICINAALALKQGFFEALTDLHLLEVKTQC